MKNSRPAAATSLNNYYQILDIEYEGTTKWYVPYLMNYSFGLDTVIEFGTWNGFSATVFGLGGVPNIISYDINFDLDRCNTTLLTELAAKENVNLQFEKGNSHVDIEKEADLIFFDTLHYYEHVVAELKANAHNAKKYFIVHDTNYPPPEKKPAKHVRDAVIEYINSHDEWELELEDTQATGIIIAKRV